MSVNVNDAVTTWNNECTAAKTDLAALEATLKADYNKYIDSLSAYLQRLKTANDMRQGYINDFGTDDIKNDTRTRNTFLYSAADPIKNNAINYILDDHRNSQVTKASIIIEACDIDKLIGRKAL